MNDNERQFEKFIHGIKFDDTPDHDHRDKLEQKLLAVLGKQPRQKEQPLKIWRIIMENRITKLSAAAAVIIIAVGLLVTILHQSATPAWAIDQTIEALKEIETIYLAGSFIGEDGSMEEFEAWARPNPKDSSISGDFRLHEGNKQTAVVSTQKNLTFAYYPIANTVYISRGINRFCYPWLGSAFFREMKRSAEDWQQFYGEDKETGRDCVFVTFTHPSSPGPSYWWVEFDLETKLPVRLKLWYKKNYEGEPAYNCTKIVYDQELSEGIFEYAIPEGAEVVDRIKLRQLMVDDANYGVSVAGLTKKEACKKVVREYWRAVVNQNWQQVKKLRPLINEEIWENLQAMYNENRPMELVEVEEPYHLNDQGTFPRVSYIIKMKNGKINKGIFHVEVREAHGNKIGVVVNSHGPELNDID